MSSSKPPFKVLVLGAGVSGLACARELASRRYQVLVVEARGRPGGRFKGQALEGNDGSDSAYVDMGGALIHGIRENPIYQLCDQMGIPTHRLEDCLLLDARGKPVDSDEDERVSDDFNECLEESFRRIQQKQQGSNTNAAPASYGRLFDSVRQEKQISESPLFQWHQVNLEVSCGESLENLGYEWNDDEPYGYDGAHVALETSGKAVVEGLAQGVDILYNSPIKSSRIVNTNDNSRRPAKRTALPARAVATPSPTRKSRRLLGEDASVRRSSRSNKGQRTTVLAISDPTSLSYDEPLHAASPSSKSESSPPKVQVTLCNGKVLEADAVVCTLPLGILKIAPGEKGHVEFDPPLPPAKQRAIQNLGCGLLNKCAIRFPHNFWHDSAEFLGVLPHHLVLNASIVTGQPILVFMFGGAQAKRIEKMADSEVMELCMDVLTTVCHGQDIPEPTDYIVTRWGQDVYSRGAFCYIPPGVAAQELSTMSEPILSQDGKPLILFAGEHTTPYHPSTLHGAFNSGIREAYRLDLTLEPALNQQLTFEPDHLYKKTFFVKRQYKVAASTTNHVGVASPQPPPRRRRHGVMTLRKRPRSVQPSLSSRWSHHGSSSTTVAQAPSRKSHRVAAKTKQTKHVMKLDDRMLMRAYESYRDWQVIRSKVLPMYGSESVSRPKSIAQLRTRHQQLQGKSQRQQKLDPQVLAEWLAVSDDDDSTSNQSPTNGQRKSDRSVKTRVVLDM